MIYNFTRVKHFSTKFDDAVVKNAIFEILSCVTGKFAASYK